MIFTTFNSFAVYTPSNAEVAEVIQVTGSRSAKSEYCHICGSLPQELNTKSTSRRYLTEREYFKLLDFSECLRNTHKKYKSCIEYGKTIANTLDKMCKFGAGAVGALTAGWASYSAGASLIGVCDLAYKDTINRTSPQYCREESNKAEDICLESAG